jgi:hypothetical protein
MHCAIVAQVGEGMPLEKLYIVLGFLFLLGLLSYAVKLFAAQNGKVAYSNKLKLISRLQLMRGERLDVVNINNQQVMIVFSRGSSPVVVPLGPDKQTVSGEGQS